MSDEHAMSTAETDDTTLVALTPADMAPAQTDLVAWCDRKLTAVKAELADLETNLQLATEHGWKYASVAASLARTEKRVLYYEKMKAAVAAGYVIVPNFPIDVFAVRVKRAKQPEKTSDSRWRGFAATPQMLPAGEGRYVDDQVLYRDESHVETVDGKERHIKKYVTDDYDEVEFPVRLVKPAVLEGNAARDGAADLRRHGHGSEPSWPRSDRGRATPRSAWEPPVRDVLRRVVARYRESLMTIPAGVCRFCGCSEYDACGYGVDRERPYLCYWTDRTQSVCSMCAPAAKAEAIAARRLANYRSDHPRLKAALDFVAAFHQGFIVGWFEISPRSKYSRNPWPPMPKWAPKREAWELGQRAGAEASRGYQRVCGPLVNAPRKEILQRR